MPLPAPTALGRGVVVGPGAPAPEPWSAAPRVVVDEAALSDPAEAVAALHAAWLMRTPVVVELAVDHRVLRDPVDHPGPAWRSSPAFTPWLDRLHFLCWANTYDARAEGRVRWWWGERALRLGATPAGDGPGDVVLPDGRSAWIDGGPRQPLDPSRLGAEIVHRDTVELQRLDPAPPPASLPDDLATALAPDQLAAVEHRPGAARILAPAGSGKTRVLTERLRLLRSWGWERDAVLAVAYNVRAREELVERTTDFRPRVQTLNSLGYAVLRAARGADLDVLDEREVRRVVQRLAPTQPRRANTDPLLPYLDALSLARLALRDPAEVEDERDDIPGFAELLPAYRRALADRGAVDYDEQIVGAVEALLADGAFRREAQGRWGRHLLVDEFQDLTPAHLLLLRLLAAPALDIFGVGDDDQVIYGHAGADPAFLVDFDAYVPGAATHALTVNYRCPRAVVRGARTLLGYNRRRVEKVIEPGPEADERRDSLAIRSCPPDTRLSELVSVVREHLDAGAAVGDVAVLARVNAQLLAPHVALAVAGIPVASTVGPQLLERTGARAALAYLRLADGPMDTADLVEVYRRPSRGLPQWFPERLERRDTWTLDQLTDLGERIGGRHGEKVQRFVADLAVVRGTSGDTVRLLRAVRTRVGLGKAAELLDGTRSGGSGSHGDDLDALEQVAALHPDPAGFERWLRAVLDAAPPDPSGEGVTIATIHRVKGQEWDHVVVHGVDDGLLPHRLAEDVEEERRVLHVAVTRCRLSVVLLADAERPSPFLDELLGLAPHRRPAAPEPAARSTGRGTAPRRASRTEPTVDAEVGIELTVLGGFRGVIEEIEDDGVLLRTDQGGQLRVRFGERVTVGASEARLRPPSDAPADDGRTADRSEALRAWRRERARTDGVPAYVVLNDRHLDGIAVRRPTSLEELAACDGIGPRKLELYGDDILEVLESLR